MTQEEAARILGVRDRTFRRYIERYEYLGRDGLPDKRLSQASFRRAPVDEVMAVAARYKSHYRGWNVKHFYSKYQKGGEAAELQLGQEHTPVKGLGSQGF